MLIAIALHVDAGGVANFVSVIVESTIAILFTEFAANFVSVIALLAIELVPILLIGIISL